MIRLSFGPFAVDGPRPASGVIHQLYTASLPRLESRSNVNDGMWQVEWVLAVRITGGGIRRSRATRGTGRLNLLLDRLDEVLESLVLDGHEDPDGVPPSVILDGE